MSELGFPDLRDLTGHLMGDLKALTSQERQQTRDKMLTNLVTCQTILHLLDVIDGPTKPAVNLPKIRRPHGKLQTPEPVKPVLAPRPTRVGKKG